MRSVLCNLLFPGPRLSRASYVSCMCFSIAFILIHGTRALAGAFPFCHTKLPELFFKLKLPELLQASLSTSTKQLLCVTQNVRPDPGSAGR